MEKHLNWRVANYAQNLLWGNLGSDQSKVNTKLESAVESWNWGKNSYSNCVLRSHTISITEREKDSGLYWRNNNKDVKETEWDPKKDWRKYCPRHFGKSREAILAHNYRY